MASQREIGRALFCVLAVVVFLLGAGALWQALRFATETPRFKSFSDETSFSSAPTKVEALRIWLYMEPQWNDYERELACEHFAFRRVRFSQVINIRRTLVSLRPLDNGDVSKVIFVRFESCTFDLLDVSAPSQAIVSAQLGAPKIDLTFEGCYGLSSERVAAIASGFNVATIHFKEISIGDQEIQQVRDLLHVPVDRN